MELNGLDLILYHTRMGIEKVKWCEYKYKNILVEVYFTSDGYYYATLSGIPSRRVDAVRHWYHLVDAYFLPYSIMIKFNGLRDRPNTTLSEYIFGRVDNTQLPHESSEIRDEDFVNSEVRYIVDHITSVNIPDDPDVAKLRKLRCDIKAMFSNRQ